MIPITSPEWFGACVAAVGQPFWNPKEIVHWFIENMYAEQPDGQVAWLDDELNLVISPLEDFEDAPPFPFVWDD